MTTVYTNTDTKQDFREILNKDAVDFITYLVQTHGPALKNLLKKRVETAALLRKGAALDFPPETAEIRSSNWTVGEIPGDLRVRHVEITGPVDRKMIINALNSGADVYMADFEDSFSPVWESTLAGQLNLMDAVRRTIEFRSPDGRIYRLREKVATLVVRPRGLHLVEKNMRIDGEPVPAALFDYGLYLFHNASELRSRGTGPYFYIPKLEHYLEARWWADVFRESEKILNLPRGSIKASALIETITAAFMMDEILYELREHITALNLGRWDYIFSFIKRLGTDPRYLMPDRSHLTMDKHFLKSAALLLVKTTHRRGAYAIGGMAAQVPIRGNPEAQEKAFAKVREDKLREISQGFDGAWVAHPDLVPLVKQLFVENMPGANQLHVKHENIVITAGDLLKIPEGPRTAEGMRTNMEVGLRYLESWLRGNGCVAINNLMEDAATFEIARAIIWQWVKHRATL
ncbi:MAG: malate synthase A, partial [Candidatus Caldarchaeum sp.]|nr:malate synthase A [Candidatus Caldarchaeum sp.]MDW8434949.1 malate synthase A [Candidatus Caldarchaeum sp.]